jgi:adenylyltransferase/sulfurtransferase
MISQSKVLVAGLGALGSTISILLARAGVGFLRIVDKDAPELHNLQRQVLYDEDDVKSGRSKAEIARMKLIAANSSIEIECVNEEIGPDNIDRFLDGIDVVVDALDNSATRYVINDAVLLTKTPYIFGGAVETSGNVMVIIPGETPCLRCLWPNPDKVKNHAKADQIGVLSAVAGIVASIQTTEALKLLIGKREDCLSGLMVIDVWKNLYCTANVERNPVCPCSELA